MSVKLGARERLDVALQQKPEHHKTLNTALTLVHNALPHHHHHHHHNAEIWAQVTLIMF